MTELLRVEGLSAAMGPAIVVQEISLRLDEGQSLALLGRNGVGKTTLLNTIIGVTRRHGGSIWLGARISPPDRPRRARWPAIGWVPQERNIFRSLTVTENLTAVARPAAGRRSACSNCFRGWPSARPTSATSSPAASSRCSRSAGRS